VQSGGPEARLRKLLGHSHAATTRRYAAHSPEQFLDADADRASPTTPTQRNATCDVLPLANALGLSERGIRARRGYRFRSSLRALAVIGGVAGVVMLLGIAVLALLESS